MSEVLPPVDPKLHDFRSVVDRISLQGAAIEHSRCNDAQTSSLPQIWQIKGRIHL